MASGSKSKSVVPKVEDDLEYDLDIDAFLNGEASALTRETEVVKPGISEKYSDAKMSTLKTDEVLDIPLTAVRDDPDRVTALVKKNFRAKSLLLHPDKLKHEDGPKAFDMLKKAEGDLQDKDKRQSVSTSPKTKVQNLTSSHRELDQLIIDSRMLVLRSLDPPLKPDTPDDYHVLRNMRDPNLQERIRRKAKELLVDEELRRRRTNKLQMIAEGSEAARKEAEVASAKRKKEEDKAWEATREDRVRDWRGFQQHGGKRKKVHHKALG